MAAETPKGAWGMTTLLFFYMLVNFADKIVVGLAAVPIMKDMGLSPEQFGLLGSMFFSLYAVSAIVVVSSPIAWRPSGFCSCSV